METRHVELLAYISIVVLLGLDRGIDLPTTVPLALLLAVPITMAATLLPADRTERVTLAAIGALLLAAVDTRVFGHVLPHVRLPEALPLDVLGVVLDAVLLSAIAAAAVGLRNVYLASFARRASRDGLTGLYNQRFFQQRIEQILAPSQRRKAPVSLVWIDIDNFKTWNDTFGHEAGDDLLRAFADHLSRPRTFRATDFVCRAGGDEFAIILPQTDATEAENVVKRLRIYLDRFLLGQGGAEGLDRPVAGRARSTMPFRERARRVQLGFSIGTATGMPGTSPAELRRWADEKMYAEKELHHSRSGGGGR